MRSKSLKMLLSAILVLSMVILAGCSGGKPADNNQAKAKVVNLYTDRHYDTDEELYKLFTADTGIQVKVVKGNSDELIERLKREGKDTEADLLITADAGRLYRAKTEALLQPVTSTVLAANVPEKFRDPQNQWFGLTKRARVIVYAKDRVNPKDLSTYEALTNAKWKGKILVRSSSNIYNQSLMAAFLELYGETYAKSWAKGVLANLAREPKGGDTDQAKAVAAGEGDLAISNTYYIGRLIGSSNPEDQKIGNSLGIFFPDQDGKGTHINVSGIGLTAGAKNKDNAIKFMEFLVSEKAQKQFAENNYEYPVNPSVEPSALLKSWGTFKSQDIHLSKLGELNAQAVKIFDEIGWK